MNRPEPTKLKPGQEVVALQDVWDDGSENGGPDTWLSGAKGQLGIVIDLDDGTANVMFETGRITIIADSEVEVTGKDFTDSFWENNPSERITSTIGFCLKGWDKD